MAHAPAVDPQRLQQRGITRDEFEGLVARGAFDDDAHVELLDGVVQTQMTPSAEHSALVRACTRLLAPAIGAFDLEVQSPIGCGPASLPEPDLALTSSPGMHARPEGARLAIEVVVTQWRAAQRKIPVYAAGGVGTYWIVDVDERRVLVHEDADGDAREYRTVRELRGNDVLRVPESDVAFSVDELFAVAERRAS